MTTIRDVAKLAGVSVATVSRVVNKKGSFSEETKSKVINAVKELNYKPNEVARWLSSKSSNIIALIVPTIDNPFFSKLAKSIEDYAHLNGYKIFLCNTNNSRARLEEYLESLRHNLVDGIIIDSQYLREDDLLQLKKNNIPVVTTDRSISSDLLSSISVNNRKGGQMATEHLLNVGCKRIGHLRGPENIDTANDRFWGYKDMVKNFEWYNPSWTTLVGFDVESGYQGMKVLLQRHTDLDGVFSSNDLVAIGAMKAAIEWGYKIPDELSIIGFDGIEFTNLMVPRITTIEQPIKEIGKIAMEEIIRIISNPDTKAKKYNLNVKLIRRESSMR